MKTSRKLAAALAVFAAGSVFFGSLPAHAKGIESDGAKVLVSRHHHGHMPPPEHFRHHGHMPSPEHFEHHGHDPHHPEHFEHHGHMPPPEHFGPHEPHGSHHPPHRPHHR